MTNIIKNQKLTSLHGRTIVYDVFYEESKRKKPVVIFSHGYKSFKDWGQLNLIGKYFAENKFVFIKFNFSHNGTTPDHPDYISDLEAFGNNNVQIETEDLSDLISALKTGEILPSKVANTELIFLVGHSRGGIISLICGNKIPEVKKISTWGAFSDFEQIWSEYYDMEKWKNEGVIYRENAKAGLSFPVYYQIFTNYIENKEAFSIENHIKKLKKPLQLVHGTDDEKVHFENALTIKKWNSKIDLCLMPGCDHNFGGFHPFSKHHLPFDSIKAADAAIEFFKSKKSV